MSTAPLLYISYGLKQLEMSQKEEAQALSPLSLLTFQQQDNIASLSQIKICLKDRINSELVLTYLVQRRVSKYLMCQF